MTQYVDLLSNREQASLILLSVFVIWGLFRREVRGSIPQLIRTFLSRAILLTLFALSTYILFEVWIGSQLGWWNTELIKGTIIWFGVSGVVLSYKGVLEANKDPQFFGNTAIATIAPTVFVTFFLNLTALSLLAEVFWQLIIAILAVMSLFSHARNEREYETVRKLCDGILALIGFSWLAYTVNHVFETWDQLDGYQLLREFALPIWLTIGLLPFLFVLSLYAAYEYPFRLLNSETNVFLLRWRARLALFIKLRFRSRSIVQFRPYWVKKLVNTNRFIEAYGVVREFKEELLERNRSIQAEQERLQHYAGVDGTDSEGRRLDRREFKETTDALRWLATCHMGHYRKRNRYDRNLLRLFNDDFTTQGLTKPSGIVMKVSRDGQRWYAYRHTVSKWCFAIGAAGPPPDQWEYDGFKPPFGFPGKDPSWGDGPFDVTVNKNWG